MTSLFFVGARGCNTPCLPVNIPILNKTAQRLRRRAEKNYGKIVFFLFSFEWQKKFAQNSLFISFFTINILSAESGADSPRSGCEAATQCTKMYTVSRRDVPNGAKVCRYMRSIILRSCGEEGSYRDTYPRQQVISRWAR